MGKFHIDNRTLGVILLISLALFYVNIPFVSNTDIAKLAIFFVSLYMVIKG